MADERNRKRHYCALDLSDRDKPDYVWKPMWLIKECPYDLAVLSVGGARIALPTLWSLLISDGELAEIVVIKELPIGKTISAFLFNPLKWSYPSQIDVRLSDACELTRWVHPAAERSEMFAVPVSAPAPVETRDTRHLREAETARAVGCLFVGDDKARLPEVLNPGGLW